MKLRTRKFLAGLLSLGLLLQAASPLSALAALLVWNTAGRPEPVNTPAFADVADADTAKAARWAVEAGLLPDMGEGVFTPARPYPAICPAPSAAETALPGCKARRT